MGLTERLIEVQMMMEQERDPEIDAAILRFCDRVNALALPITIGTILLLIIGTLLSNVV